MYTTGLLLLYFDVITRLSVIIMLVYIQRLRVSELDLAKP